MRPTKSAVVLAGSLATLALAGCGGGDTVGPAPEDLQDYITALTTVGGVVAVFHPGSAPSASGGPVLTLTGGGGAMITGGSSRRSVTSATAFDRLIVAIEGVDGWWEITLPAPVTAEELVVTMNQQIPDLLFVLNVGAAEGSVVGPYGFETVQVIPVGAGQLQVSVSWDSDADIDLYLIEPGTIGEEIYFGNRTSAYGGFLDLDSNAGCNSPDIRNENITFPGTPQSGTYTIRVNLWAECDNATTNFVVTLRKQGQLPEVFYGVRTAPATPSGHLGGAVVTTFTWP